MDTRDTLIHELQQVREHMRRVVLRTSLSQEIYPNWRMKEVLDHLTGWDDATLRSLQAHAAGREPDTPAARGINYYNAQSVSERETLDLTHTIQEWEVTRQQLIDLIHNLPPEKVAQPFIVPWGPTSTLEELIQIFIDHEEEHATEIEGILDAVDQGQQSQA